MEISIFQLFRLAWKKWYIILVAALVLSGFAGGYIKMTSKPQYKANTTIYLTTPQNNEAISASQTTAIRDMITTYSDMIKSNRVMDEVRNNTFAPYTNSQLMSMLNITKNEDSLVFMLSVTAGSREEAILLVNAISDQSITEIKEIIPACEGQVIDHANMDTVKDVSSSALKYAIVGFMLGAVAAYAFIFLRFIMDTTIRKKEDMVGLTELPIIGMIPSLNDTEDKKKGEIQ
jgi:capsular polysaccharide biosynthesis protein